LETLLPKLTLSLEAGRDARAYFAEPRVADVWLEIGFGGGEHLLWQAEAHPNVGIIGAEPYISGVAKLLSKLAGRADRTDNIRLYAEDARDIIDALPEASIGRVFVLFPDPWPKTRHHKRRFIQMAMLDQLARIMKAGAEIRFATDDAGYLVWALRKRAQTGACDPRIGRKRAMKQKRYEEEARVSICALSGDEHARRR
jgi:tRNA (guanine-N7-)-methyltransferase